MIPHSQCHCECHVNPAVCHCAPCCYPDDLPPFDITKAVLVEFPNELNHSPVKLQHQAKPQYCCREFRKIVERPETVFSRETTFTKNGNEWWTDFSDGEYGDIRLVFCPFCGKKL